MLEWLTRTPQRFTITMLFLGFVVGYTAALTGVYGPIWLACILPGVVGIFSGTAARILAREYVARQLSFRDTKIYMSGLIQRDVQ